MTNSDSICRRAKFSCTGSSAIFSVIGRYFSSVVLAMIILLQGIFLPLPATAKTPADGNSCFSAKSSLHSYTNSAQLSNSLPHSRISCCHLNALLLAKAMLLLAVLRFPSLRSSPSICYRHTESSNTSLSPAPISHKSRPLMNRWTTPEPSRTVLPPSLFHREG